MDSFPSRIVPCRLLWCLCVLLLLAGPAHAQSSGNGSIYSLYGLGTLEDFSSSQGSALGEGGYALRSLNYNPTANPALWSDQVFTRLSAGASYHVITASNTRGTTSLLSSGTIDAVQFNFPLLERKLGVGLSFQPYTRANHRIARSDSVQYGTAGRFADYTVTFKGNGGLHSFRGGLGYRIGEALSVGASVDFIFGILERERRTDFSQAAPLQDALVSESIRLSGVTGTLGGQLTLANVLRADDAFSLGAAVTLPTTLSGTRTRSLEEETTRDTLATSSGEVSLPWRGRLGVAYQPNQRWTFVADGRYEPWSSFSSSFAPSSSFSRRFPFGGTKTLTDRWRLSTGVELVPGGGETQASYLQRVAYRLGVYTEQMYIRPNASTSLQTFAITGGISLPTSLSGTRIDLNLKAGTRGTTSQSLVRDNFFGISLYVNFGERWFQQRKLR